MRLGTRLVLRHDKGWEGIDLWVGLLAKKDTRLAALRLRLVADMVPRN